MNFRHIFGSSESRQQKLQGSDAKTTVVRRAADTALRQYEKTFKDLARYDRGEKLALPR